MRLSSLLLLLSLLLSSCGQGSSKVTVGEHTLKPRDTLFWTGLVQSSAVTRIIVTDQSGVCARLPDLDACTSAAMAGTPPGGTYLWLGISGAAIGEYEVAGKDRTRLAEAVFSVRSTTEATFTARAVSGTVAFSELYPGSNATGRYTLKLDNGETIDGNFVGQACTELDALMKRVADAQLTCSTSFTSTSCNARCSCSARANSADCVRTDSTSDWSCTCNRSGEMKKCAVAKTEANVCAQGNGCCDTSF